MANRYWVGGSGSWSDASNHWASTSGGSGAGVNLPTINDDVYFNAQSFDASGTITLDISANCKNFDWTGLDSSVWFLSSVQSAYIYGDISLNTNLQWRFSSTSYTYLLSDLSTCIRSNGTNISPGRVYKSGQGYCILADDYRAQNAGYSSYFYITRGTFDTNGKIFTTNYIFGTVGSLYPQILLRDSSLYIDYLRFEGDVSFGCGTSNIYIPYYLWGYGKTFHNVYITGSSYNYSLTGNNTFNNLTFSANNSATFGVITSGNQIINNLLTINGNTIDSRYRFLLASSTLGTKYSILANDISLSAVDFRDISVGGTANWDLSNIPGGSGDCGGNIGITFTPSTSCYFVHTSGNASWSDTSKWMSTSGGSTYARGPLPQDDAIFDENSFTGNSTLFTNITRLPNIDYTNVDVSLTMSLTSNIECYGNVIFNNNITVSGNYSLALLNRSTYSIDLKNKHIYSLNPALGNCIINSNIDSSILTIGAYGIPMSFDLNDFNIHADTMYIQYGVTSAKMGNGIINLYSSAAGNILGINYVPGFNAENSTIIFNSISGTNDINIYLYVHTYEFNKLIFSGTHQGFYTLSSSNILCKEILFAPKKKIKFSANTTLTVLDKFIASGTLDASIYIGSTTSSPFTLNASAGNTRMQLEHCFIQNSTASPNNRWYAQNSVDLGGNSGWNFKEYSLKPIRIGNKIINKHIEK